MSATTENQSDFFFETDESTKKEQSFIITKKIMQLKD